MIVEFRLVEESPVIKDRWTSFSNWMERPLAVLVGNVFGQKVQKTQKLLGNSLAVQWELLEWDNLL